MQKNIIHRYFKKELEQGKILVQINPENFSGLELLVDTNGRISKTRRTFDEMIYEDLAYDDFHECSPLEFNLYLKGLAK